MKRKNLVVFLKITFSVLMIGYVFGMKVDIRQVAHSLSNPRWEWFAAGAALHITGLLISAARWKILLKAQDMRAGFGRLVSYYLVGHFFNMFLPTKVGGDVVRVYDTSRDHGSSAQPLAVVLVERISGLLIMLLIAALVLALDIDIGVDVRAKVPGIQLAVGVMIAAICCFPLMFHPRLERLWLGIVGWLPRGVKLQEFLHKIFEAFRVYAGKSGYLLGALGMGTLLQFNYFLHYYFIARAVGMDVMLSFFLVVIPVRTVALMIPFFINGIGLREFFDIHAFGLLGISRNTAVAFAELAWLVQIGFALIGGAIYILRNPERKTG